MPQSIQKRLTRAFLRCDGICLKSNGFGKSRRFAQSPETWEVANAEDGSSRKQLKQAWRESGGIWLCQRCLFSLISSSEDVVLDRGRGDRMTEGKGTLHQSHSSRRKKKFVFSSRNSSSRAKSYNSAFFLSCATPRPKCRASGGGGG